MRCCYLAVLLMLSWNVASSELPVEAYASLPAFKDLELSPDGKKILMLRARDESYHLTVLDIQSNANKLLMASDPDRFIFNWCHWANNTRVVCSIRSYAEAKVSVRPGMVLSGGKYRTTFTNLLAIDADSTNYLQLVPKAYTSGRGDVQYNSISNANVVSWLKDDDAHILLALRRDNRGAPSVYKLNIYDNEMTRVVKARRGIQHWKANRAGVVRTGMGYGRKGIKVLMRENADDRFKTVDSAFLKNEFDPALLTFSDGGKSAYLNITNGEDKAALWRVNLETLKAEEKVLADPDFDIQGTLFSSKEGKPVLMVYYRDVPVLHWFNSELERTFNEVSATMPGEITFPVSASDQYQQWILANTGATLVPTYYYYDVSTRQLIRIGADYDLVGDDISPVTAISYQARDGMTIPAYLTLPVGKGKNLPTIVLPHGGPTARDLGIFDYWSQFLASRGYAVLRPNFRGSYGYGEKHRKAGYGEWGEKMQNDVIDGLDHLVSEGITDADKVCIVGGSYGGYVALVAGYKTPERFRCAVSFGGVADLEVLIKNLRSSEIGDRNRAMIQSDTSWSKIAESSPVLHADKFDVPLLLVHGDTDHTVFIEQSEAMADALRASNKQFEYIVQEGGDHYLSRQSHRLEFFAEMETFLKRYLKSD